MQTIKTKAEQQQSKAKLASSYTALLEEFSASTLHQVGNYTVGSKIAEGSFGKVYLARHNLTNGTKVVLKAASKEDPNLAREIHHHRQFTHPHIARLYEVIVTEKQVWMVLEFCPGDELYNYLVKEGNGKGLPLEQVQRVFAQIVGAVTYIHSKSCVHRDLKLENVLLDKNGSVKLIDFGFTREYEGKASYLQTYCGTVCYSAPEMLKGEKYAGEKVDAWSLGIMLYALLRGELPFDSDHDDEMETKHKILKEEPLYPPEVFNDQARNLVQKLLSKRPLHRPSLAEVLADPFLVDHAPAQQAILKLSQPPPFSTALEKATLERMKSAGVDIDKVIENVISQRCDSLAGWWALLIEKEAKKEAKRERKRKEREADLKILRRLSGASSRLERVPPTLEEVAEEGGRTALMSRPRSTSRGSQTRGRTNRRSTPQILVGDLPQLPEGRQIVTPIEQLSHSLIEPRRSKSTSRPPIPAKDRQRRRSSHLQIVTASQDLPPPPVNGINKRKFGKGFGKSDKKLLSQFAALKSWFVDSTKRAKSPGSSNVVEEKAPQPTLSQPAVERANMQEVTNKLETLGHSRDVSGTTTATRNSYGATLTPTATNLSNGGPGRLDMNRTRNRQSPSPSPITPRSSFRRSSRGMRGRKSTSSSVSSVRSIPHYNHSKASSVSSDSHDHSTIHSPATRSVGRSPHHSVKVLPATPSSSAFPVSARTSSRGTVFDDTTESDGHGVMFARRKRSPFKGPTLSTLGYGKADSPIAALRSPAIFATNNHAAFQNRVSSATHTNFGLLEVSNQRAARAPQRKSLVICEEEDEEEEAEYEAGSHNPIMNHIYDDHDAHDNDDDDGSIEEVDAFPPVNLRHGEKVHSIIFLDDPITPHDEAGLGEDILNSLRNLQPQQQEEEQHNLQHRDLQHDMNGNQALFESNGNSQQSLGPSPRTTVQNGMASDHGQGQVQNQDQEREQKEISGQTAHQQTTILTA